MNVELFLTVGRYLDQPLPEGGYEVTDAAGYFVRVLGSHDAVDSAFHRRVRKRGVEEAGAGRAALVERLRGARQELGERLPSVGPDTPVAALDAVVLGLEQYLATRLVELVIHLDDLAVSVGIEPPPDVPQEAYEVVAAVLATIAARRAGPLDTIRSLARRERQPEAVRAL